jgi:hypothetical protein
MTNRVTWRLAAVAAALLAAGTARAGYQEERSIGWLGTGGWQVRESDGEVYLEVAPYSGRAAHTEWTVSAPAITTFKAGSGMNLGYDAKGRDPKVRLVTEKGEGKGAEGASTRWAFEVVKRLEPRYEFARGGGPAKS